MADVNTGMLYETGRGDLSYSAISAPDAYDDCYQWFPEQTYNCSQEIRNDWAPMAAEGQGPSSASCVHSPNDEDLEMKKLFRRIQNREAASRCRRKKTDRIAFLRESLHAMYARSLELRNSIAAVEAEIEGIKSAIFARQYSSEQGLIMLNEVEEKPADDSYLSYLFTLENA